MSNMAATLSITELRGMQVEDLRKEAAAKRTVIAKLKLGIEMQKEKDTAKLRRERRALARMETILGEKNQTNQKKQKKQLKKVS